MDKKLVVIDIGDIHALKDKALEACGYHNVSSGFRIKQGLSGDADHILDMENRKAAQMAATIIDFILKNGKPL